MLALFNFIVLWIFSRLAVLCIVISTESAYSFKLENPFFNENALFLKPQRRIFKTKVSSGDKIRVSDRIDRISSIFSEVEITTSLSDYSPRTLIIDNYDSYTYNIWQLVAKVNKVEPTVVFNDDFPSWAEICKSFPDAFDNIVISPGPGVPTIAKDFGVCADIILNANIPIFGICLGHQGIASTFCGNSQVGRGMRPVHGEISFVTHTEEGIFKGIPQNFPVVRYHSLVAYSPLRSPITATAWTRETLGLPHNSIDEKSSVAMEDGEQSIKDNDIVIMGLQHESKPIYGVQFHPESIATEFGEKMFENFKELSWNFHAGRFRGDHRILDCASPDGENHETLSVLDDGQPCINGADSAISEGNYHPIAKEGHGSAQSDSTVFISRKKLSNRLSTEQLFSSLYSDCNQSFWLDSSSHLSSPPAVQGTQQRSSLSYMGALESEGSFAVEYYSSSEVLLRYSNGSVNIKNSSIFDYIREHTELKVNYECDDTCASSELPFEPAKSIFGYIGYETKLSPMTTQPSKESKSSEASTPAARSGFSNHEDITEPVVVEEQPQSSIPSALFLSPKRFLVYHHDTHSIFILAIGDRDGRTYASDSIKDLSRRIDAIESMADSLNLDETCAKIATTVTPEGEDGSEDSKKILRSHRSKAQYRADIEYCQEQIRAGESYELCLTTQFSGPFLGKPLETYLQLRKNNPAPYSCYLHYDPILEPNSLPRKRSEGGFSICCSSPEQFLRVDSSGNVESKPIKGTTPRDHLIPERDRQLAEALRMDRKTRAENLMIVDLLRNDLGKVCEIGSVSVPSLMHIESFASVHQLVSTITGKLRRDSSIADLLIAAFPGGSMTGAPKKRSMEILAGVEKAPRGIYSGTIGHIDSNRAADLNIIIRTAIIADGMITIAGGGAIIALSEPEAELLEVALKATSVSRAIGYVLEWD